MRRPTWWLVPIVVGAFAIALSGCALALGSPLAWLAGLALAALAALAACGAHTPLDDDADVEAGPDADVELPDCGGGRCPDYMTCTATPEYYVCYPDVDGDGVLDREDDCPWLDDGDQADADGDGVGDACDLCEGDNSLSPCGEACCTDADGDGVSPADGDTCPYLADPGNPDRDGDFRGDACDLFPDEPDMLSPCGDTALDSDADGLLDWGRCGEGPEDLCPTTPSADSGDHDGDSTPDVCDEDGAPPLAMTRPEELRRTLLARLAAGGVLDADTVSLALG